MAMLDATEQPDYISPQERERQLREALAEAFQLIDRHTKIIAQLMLLSGQKEFVTDGPSHLSEKYAHLFQAP